MKHSIRLCLIALLFCLISNCLFDLVNASIYIDGGFCTDDTWTKEDSPYTITGNLTINNLTIQPGASVDMDGHFITIYGSLSAEGTSEEKITFNNGALILGTNNSYVTIENSVFTDSSSLIIISGSPTISHCYFASRLIVKDGSPIISNNVLLDGVHADSKGGPVTIKDNQIRAKNGWTPIYVQGIHGDITGNVINGNGTSGISLPLAVTSATITNNIIYNCEIGICAPDDNVEVASNVIFNCSVGIYVWGLDATLYNNTIRFNEVGIQCTHASIHQNNIYNNSRLNLENLWLARVDATDNWWGTTISESVQQSIYWDTNYSGTVDYLPILTSPNPLAPKIPENLSAIASPTPTASEPVLGLSILDIGVVITLLAVAALAVALVVMYRRKRH
jgi:parallel beta-helix repeat protein